MTTIIAGGFATIADAEGAVARLLELGAECGAIQVERAQGTWADGEWADFDPLVPPHLIGGREMNAPRPSA